MPEEQQPAFGADRLSTNPCGQTSIASRPSLCTLPVSIYLAQPTGDEVANVEETVIAICQGLGFELIAEHDPEMGSWFRKFVFRTKEAATSEQVQSRILQLERAIQIQYLDSPQSTVDERYLKHIPELLSATQNDDIVIRLGPLILVAWHNANGRRQVMIQTLTTAQMLELEKHPQFFKEPEAMFNALKVMTDSDKPDSSAGHVEPAVPKQPLNPTAR